MKKYVLFYLIILLAFEVKAQKTLANPITDWKLGVSMITFRNISFIESLDKLESCQIRLVEGLYNQSMGSLLKGYTFAELSPSEILFLKNHLEQKNIKIGSILIAGSSNLESWIEQFEVARQFGVKFLVADPPRKLLNDLDSLAGLYGVRLALHNFRKEQAFSNWHPDSVLTAIRGHHNFGASVDLGNWAASGVDPVEGVRKLAGHIISIHLKDIDPDIDPCYKKDVKLGTGIIDFSKIFKELKRQNFKGNIYIERETIINPDNLKSVVHSINFYNTILKGL